MQTFLPYEEFDESASVLDDKRLGKQRVETFQIMSALLDVKLVTSVIGKAGIEELPPSEWYLAERQNRSWMNHPAVKMWRGYTLWLYSYQVAVCAEWITRGFRDTCANKSMALILFSQQLGYLKAELGPRPPWLGDEAFHMSHRSNLLAKDPEFYGPVFPDTPPGLPYIWPAA